MWKIIYVYIFVFSFCFAYILIRFLRKAALRFNLVDKPDEKRKIHKRAMPLLGGIGMYLAFSLSIIAHVIFVISREDTHLFPVMITEHISGIKSVIPQITAIIATTFLMVIVGVIDDFRKITPKLKLFFQIVLALTVFASGIRINLFLDNTFISAILTIGWIVGITNAFNLMDNMDGLSSGTAFISTLIFFLISSLSNQFFVATILASFAGVLLGFLIMNFPPAKIFMGDAGSLFIGYTLSILTIINTYYTPESTPTAAAVIMPLLILSVPVFDTFSVMYIRLKNKVSIFTADRNHLSHRLINMGMSTKQTVLFIYLVNLCIGLGALLLGELNRTGCIIVLAQAITMLAIIVILERVKKCHS